MADTIKYITRRQFKYAGRWLKIGDEWTPGGSRHDGNIIRNRLVIAERVEVPDKPTAEKRATRGR